MMQDLIKSIRLIGYHSCKVVVKKTRHLVRSAMYKLVIGRLAVESETTSESLLFYVLGFSHNFFGGREEILICKGVLRQFGERGRVQARGHRKREWEMPEGWIGVRNRVFGVLLRRGLDRYL